MLFAALALAPGGSSRMERPKPLVQLAARPMLTWVLEPSRLRESRR